MSLALSDAMFLCPQMAEIVLAIRANHRSAFLLAEDVNVFANHQVFETEVRKSDLQQVLVSSLLPRLLSAFQACVITGERGLSAELRLLTRKVLEVTFRVVAVSRSEDVARKYLRSDEAHRRKLLNKLRLLRSVSHTDAEVAKIAAILADVTATLAAENIEELGTWWFAKEAQLSDLYNSAYAVLSESAHANVRDLDALVEKDCDGDIEALRYGPDPVDVGDLLCTAIEAVIIALKAAFSILPNGDHAGIERLHERMNDLFVELESKPIGAL